MPQSFFLSLIFMIFVLPLCVMIYQINSLTGTLNPTQLHYYDQYQMQDWNNSLYMTIESKYVPSSFQYTNKSFSGVNTYHIFSVQANEIFSTSTSYVFLTYLKVDTTAQTLTHFFEISTQLQKYTEKFVISNLNYEGYWYTLEIRNNVAQQTLNITFYQNTNKNNIFNKIYKNEYFAIDKIFSFYLGDSKISQALHFNQIPGPIKYQIISDSARFTPQSQTCTSNSGYALRAIANYSTSQYYEYSIKDIVSKSYGIGTWVKINQNIKIVNNQINIVHIQQNPAVNYITQIGGRLLNVFYNINSTKQLVTVIYQSYTFPIKPVMSNGVDPLEKTYIFEISTLYSLYDWHFFGFSYRNNQISVLISFPKISQQISKTISSVYQFSDVYLVVHFGGTSFNSSNNDGQFFNTYFYTCLPTFTPICHITCSTCFGPNNNQCLTCSSSSNRILSFELKCTCKVGFLDVGQSSCYQASTTRTEILIPLSKTVGYDQESPQVVCSYGYFKYNDECFQCPKLNIRYFCPECIQYPNSWVDKPICTKAYSQYNLGENNTFVQDIITTQTSLLMVLDPYDVYLFNDGELQFCPYCNSLCLIAPYDSACQLSSYYHLNKNIMVICYFRGILKDSECRLCPALCNRCAFINQEYICVDQYYTPVKIPGCKTTSSLGCADCIDFSKYYLSLDQSDCYLCSIPNCKYCFQYHSQSAYINSIYKMSNITFQLEDLITGCSLCYNGYIYNFQSGKCEINTYALGSTCINYYISDSGIKICLTAATNDFTLAVSVLNCQSYLTHCIQCIKPNENQYYCMQCEAGYYLHRNLGNCQSCVDYNTLYSECYQESSLVIQNYKYEILPQIFSLTSYYPINVAQTATLQLQIAVTVCSSQYQPLSDQQCSLIDLQNCNFYSSGCRTCASTIEGTKRLTIINLKCSDCPYYCEYCKPRLQSEVFQVNPYLNFTSLAAVQLSYRCIMKSSTQQNAFFDNEQQIVRICSADIPKCQLEFQLKYTSFQDIVGFFLQYYATLNYASYYSLRSVTGFQLIVNSSSNFITANSILGLMILDNTFIQSVLSLKYIKIIYFSTNISVNFVFGELEFQNFQFFNFTTINLSFSITKNSKLNLICLKDISLFLLNVIISDSYLIPPSFRGSYDTVNLFRTYQISIQNPIIINFTNVIMQNISLVNTNFIDLSNVDVEVAYLNYLYFRNVTFLNCSFQNTSILTLYSVNQYQSIQLINLNFINCIFVNSYFFQSLEFEYYGQFLIDTLFLKNCTFQNSLLIITPICDFMMISNLAISNTTFLDSRLIALGSSAVFNIITISDCVLKNSIIVDKAKNTLSNKTETYKFQNIAIFNCQYSQSSFISIHQNEKEIILIYINNLKSHSLSLLFGVDGFNQQNYLFQFEGQQITITNLDIIRQPGAIDYSFSNFNFVVMQYISISSSLLQKDLDLNNVRQQSLNTIFIINTLNLQLKDINIKNQLSADVALIIITKSSGSTSNGAIQISNLSVLNCQLIKTTFQYISTILSISTSINVDITIFDSQINGVWLNEYVQDPKIFSAALVVITSESGNVYFSSIAINDVIVTNSSNSIFYVQSDLFQVSNLTSLNINNFETYMEKYSQSGLMKFDTVQTINCQGGLAYLQIKQFTLKDSIFINSTGLTGGVFNIITEFNGILRIYNSSFINSSTSTGNSNEGRGGCIYIDSENSYLNLLIKDSTFIKSTSGYQGGVFYLKPSYHKSIIELSNLSFIDSFSVYYPIIFFQNIEITEAFLSSVTIRNLQFSNSFQGFSSYLKTYGHDLATLTINETSAIFSFTGCQVKISGMNFIGFTLHPLLFLSYTKILTLNNIEIYELSHISQYLIYIENNEQILSSLSIAQLTLQKISNYDAKSISPNDINYNFTDYQNNFKYSSLISLVLNQNQHSINIQKVQILSNRCEKCLLGLLQVNNKQDNATILFNNLYMMDNYCGYSSCLTMSSNNKTMIHKISQSKFIQNQAILGGCIYFENIGMLLKEGIFFRNYATQSGGAIYYINPEQEMIMYNVYFIQNSAQKGGALLDYNIRNITCYKHAFFIENVAQIYGNNIVTQPSRLSILMNNIELLSNETQINNKIIEKIIYYNHHQLTKFIYLPSGTSMYNYQKFNQQSFIFQTTNYSLLLLAQNFLNEQMYELNQTYCFLDGSKIKQDGDTISSTIESNAISSSSVFYNNENNLYDLGQLIFIFYPYSKDSEYLQVDIQCNSIQNANYSIRFNIKTLKCQIGEYYSDNECIKCDFERGYYSVEYKSTSCKRIDISMIKNTTGAMIEMQEGYWRYSYRSDLIEKCSKYSSRCLGGWNVSSETCDFGSFGALCEECDLLNIRGQGSFLNTREKKCQFCGSYGYQWILALGESFWIVLFIFLTVRSTHNSNKQLFKLKCLYRHFGALYKSTIDQTSMLIKIANNIFQILTIAYTFQIEIFDNLSTLVLFLGDSTYMATYQLDCSIPLVTTVNFEYAHFIVILILPFLHFTLCCFIYLIMVFRKQAQFTRAYLYSAIIYLYCLNQQNIVKWGISLISKRSISGIDWIQANVAAKFETETHALWQYRFIYPMLSLYGIAIPLLLFISLRNVKDHLDEKLARLKYSFLYNEYNRDSYYWEIIKMLQKILIILIAIYYEQFILLKGIIIFLIVLLYCQFCQEIQPYKIQSMNQIDFKTSFLSALVIIFSLLLYVIQLQSEYLRYLDYIVQMIILLLIIKLLEVLLRRILIAYLNKLDLQFDALRIIIRQRFPFLAQTSCLKQVLALKTEQQERVQSRYRKIRLYLKQVSKVIKEKGIMNSQKDVSYILSPKEIFSSNTSRQLITDRGTLKST